tara:strand:+ start:527 stop:910 length:384 start_codon:yes stop_codon:yes gene_type:complete
MAERKIVFLDTHVVVWLYLGKKIFTNRAHQLMNESDLRISPIVRLELMLLYRKGRITHPYNILSYLKKYFLFDEDRIDFSLLINKCLSLEFTNDPFDRLIAAHAAFRETYLITKDRDLLQNLDEAIW